MAQYNKNEIRSELCSHDWQFKNARRYRKNRRIAKESIPLDSVGPLLNNMVVPAYRAAELVRETAINAMNEISSTSSNTSGMSVTPGKKRRVKMIKELNEQPASGERFPCQAIWN